MPQFGVHSQSLDLPPPFDPPNVIELVSTKAGKITHVRVYSSHAEVTRVFKFPIEVGQNQVTISGFPDVLDDHLIKVECDGPASVRDVTISETTIAPPATSAKLDELTQKRARVSGALTRTRGWTNSRHIKFLDMNTIIKEPGDKKSIVREYIEASDELDDHIFELEEQISQLDKEIEEERRAISGNVPKIRYDIKKVTTSIFGEATGEVDLTIRYAVTIASWSPVYDIQVSSNTKEKRVTIIYKASITQTTGESWDDVPLTLDTTMPSTAIAAPKLLPWRLELPHIPTPVPNTRKTRVFKPLAPTNSMLPPVRASSPKADTVTYDPWQYTSDFEPAPIFSNWPQEPWQVSTRRQSTIASLRVPTEGVTASFDIPGLTTVPSDRLTHTITIVNLELDAELSWVGTSTSVQLMAKVKNTSTYPLIAGSAFVYLDGSMVSQPRIPLVCPNESFDCQLGVDSSLRVYQSNETCVGKKRFFSKSITHTFTRHISILNNKPYDISSVKIIDNIPIASEPAISIKLLSPALSVTPFGKNKSPVELAKVTNITGGVVAQWENAKCSEVSGTDGMLSWTCNIPSQGKVDFVLSCEVTVPTRYDTWLKRAFSNVPKV